MSLAAPNERVITAHRNTFRAVYLTGLRVSGRPGVDLPHAVLGVEIRRLQSGPPLQRLGKWQRGIMRVLGAELLHEAHDAFQ